MSHSSTDKFNVLIKAMPTTPAYLSGVVVAPGMPVQMALNGMPQTARMGHDASLMYQFQIQSTAEVHVLATAYSGLLPQMSLLYFPTANSLPTTPPMSYFTNDSDAVEGFISFIPRASDVGTNFLVQLQSDNMSYVSLALRLALGEGEDNSITGIAAADPPAVGSPTHTVVMLNGQPLRDQVGEDEEHLYVFYVPTGVTGTITISLDPIQVCEINYKIFIIDGCVLFLSSQNIH